MFHSIPNAADGSIVASVLLIARRCSGSTVRLIQEVFVSGDAGDVCHPYHVRFGRQRPMCQKIECRQQVMITVGQIHGFETPPQPVCRIKRPMRLRPQ